MQRTDGCVCDSSAWAQQVIQDQIQTISAVSQAAVRDHTYTHTTCLGTRSVPTSPCRVWNYISRCHDPQSCSLILLSGDSTHFSNEFFSGVFTWTTLVLPVLWSCARCNQSQICCGQQSQSEGEVIEPWCELHGEQPIKFKLFVSG